MSATIKNMQAREIFDSRGSPTLEVEVLLSDGSLGRYSVPSGASVGTFEAHELRDVEFPERLNGKGLRKAISSINDTIFPALKGLECTNQSLIDNTMIILDGTSNKSNLGANSLLGVSMSVCVAAAKHQSIPLYSYISKLSGLDELCIPAPMMNFINGGLHASNGLSIQEFMVTPFSNDFGRSVFMLSEIFVCLKEILSSRNLGVNVGDEGGFVPIGIENTTDALDLLVQAIDSSGYSEFFGIALDSAASSFCSDGIYFLDSKKYDSNDLIGFYQDLVNDYPIISIEDPLDEMDHDGWYLLTKSLGDTIAIVGDDLCVTNEKLIKSCIDKSIANSILIKPNQIGTLTETIQAAKIARQNNYQTIISHRSGDTEDVSLPHIGIGIGASRIKSGSICRSERVAKYNELLRISEIFC